MPIKVSIEMTSVFTHRDVYRCTVTEMTVQMSLGVYRDDICIDIIEMYRDV